MPKEVMENIIVDTFNYPWIEDKINGNQVKELVKKDLSKYVVKRILPNGKPIVLDDFKPHPVKNGDSFITQEKDQGIKEGA